MHIGTAQFVPHPLARPAGPKPEPILRDRPEVAPPAPHDAAPGEVPFADFLRTTNETDRPAPHRPAPDARDRYEPSTPRPDPARACGCPAPTRHDVPRLGDVSPVEPPATAPAPDVRPITRVMSPIGAMIDLTA